MEARMDCYIEWRYAATAAADAYRRWADAPTDRRAHGFLGYVAALDQEESAAFEYTLAAADVEQRLQRDHGRKTEQ
jgi:hypothetical protein